MRPLLLLNERDLRHPHAGGAEVNLFEVGRRLAARGYRPTLLCSRFAGAAPDERIDGIRVIRRGNRLTYYLQLPALVRRHLEPTSVIVEHLCKIPFCTPLYARAPVLAITHHLFGATAFRQVPFVVAAMVVASERLIPPVYRRCRFVAVSPSTRSDLVARGMSPDQIRVVPNGVDSQKYRLPTQPPPQPPTLLALGRVEPYKRLDLTLQVLARVRREIPRARLVVVGAGSGMAELQGEMRRLGLTEHVECTGIVSEEEKVRRIQMARLIVNTSEKEGWGLTVLEAAACGVPAVASDVPGLRDAVRSGQTGVLVPHGDVDSCARAIIALLGDEDRRRALGRAARAWAERFDWETIADATAACIEEASGGEANAGRWTWFQE
jgi:glycosyltransferase involved in cell wall biosynthesis